MKTKVFVDPSSDALYLSFYLKGLYSIFGKKNVSFSPKYFKTLKKREESHSHDQYTAFVVIDTNNNIKKYIVDFRDKMSVKESAYEWCDKYAKINFNVKLTNKKFHDKIISIAPGTGINVWNFWETVYYCIANLILIRFSPIVSFRRHLQDYYAQFTRSGLEDYLPEKVDESTATNDSPYVFLIGTLWPHENCITGTNLQRKTFIEICKKTGCNFEGGFFVRKNHPQFKEYKDIILKKWYSNADYIKKSKQSLFVYNTPAVHNCHGWKLAEYLAMGKAIISDPISNELPEDLKHGKNIHIVKNTGELENAIKLLLTDNSYRKKLEAGAKEYYSKHVSPEKVIEQILHS